MARYLVCLDPISPYSRFDKSTMCLCFVSLHLLSTGPVFSQKVSILPRYLFLSLSRSTLPPSPTQWKWSSDTRREASLALPSALLSVSHVLTPIARRRRRRRRPSEISRGERERGREAYSKIVSNGWVSVLSCFILSQVLFFHNAAASSVLTVCYLDTT